MEKKKIDKVIEAFRNHITFKEENGMVANAPGSQGGGGSQTDPKGTAGLVGFDPVIGAPKRRKIIGLGKNSRKRWMNNK